MELDDMFYMGKRPITLRLVLGLMEDADNSLETYRWAMPALLHSIHTKDTTLSDYVKEVFEQKGLTPYKPYQEEEKTERLSADEQLRKVKMDAFMMRSKAKIALEELMALKDAKGLPLFCQKNHWWAVFRIFVDLQVCGIRENRYKEFLELIEKLQLNKVKCRTRYDHTEQYHAGYLPLSVHHVGTESSEGCQLTMANGLRTHESVS